MTISVLAEGMPEYARYLAIAPELSKRAARLAINDTASRKGVRAIRDAITEQVAFPDGYLTNDRIGVRQFATEDNLQAAIVGRQIPTSLARFAIGGSVGRGKSVALRVQPGSVEEVTRAFLIRLSGGADSFNMGLAIRLRPGERLANRAKATTEMKNGLTLLYGPSVDQVFRTVAVDVAPALADALSAEFIRQFVRLSGEV